MFLLCGGRELEAQLVPEAHDAEATVNRCCDSVKLGSNSNNPGDILRFIPFTHFDEWRPAVSDKGHMIAFAFALAPAAFIAWASKTRSVFIGGVIGAIVRLYLAPTVMSEWTDYNERDAIIDTIGWDAPYTLVGAVVGSCLLQTNSWNRRNRQSPPHN